MSLYPRHIAQAFLAVDDEDPREIAEEDLRPYYQVVEEAIRRFAKRRGGLDENVSVSCQPIKITSDTTG